MVESPSSLSGEWLKNALSELCGKMESGLELDGDLIGGLVSFCELAPPPDAADYLSNIIGPEAGKDIIEEYLSRRGFVNPSNSAPAGKASSYQAYVKPRGDEGLVVASKKQERASKQTNSRPTEETNQQAEPGEFKSISQGNPNSSKKKKSGKVISLAEAAKGSIVFQQGKPCSCQARRHKLVSNCLSCGKIVCEQEGEGPCSFCGALVLREDSSYAGLDDGAVLLSESEAAAEAYAKRLVDYDRNSAARTKVIDDQSDYYEIEGNSWLSAEEKQLLQKKQKEKEEADAAQKRKVIVTFDLLGRKVLVNTEEASKLESEYSILRPPDDTDANRIKPNPSVRLQPVFVDPGRRKDSTKGKQSKRRTDGLCLEISGRVQHGDKELLKPTLINTRDHGKSVIDLAEVREGDDIECSLDYN